MSLIINEAGALRRQLHTKRSPFVSGLQEQYYDEYKCYDLVTLSIAVVFPLVRKYFLGWQPLSKPNFGKYLR